MYKKKEISIWNLIFGVVILYIIMPIISRAISTYLTTYFMLLIVLLIYFHAIWGYGVESFNAYIGGLMLPFIFFQVVMFTYRTNSLLLWGYSVLLWLIPLVIGYYFIQYRIKDITIISRIIIIAFISTIVTTCVGLVQNPFASRVLATISSSQDVNAILYNWKNIGGYEFVYFLVLLYPILILAYKRRRINLVLTAIGTFMIFVTVILSEYATALLLIMCTSILFFCKKNLDKRDVYILLVVSTLILVFFSDSISTVLAYIAKTIGSETIGERFLALAGGSDTLNSFDDNRIELYQRSLNTFLEHPIVGTFFSRNSAIGGHSFILDTLAQMGILGGLLLFSMYKKIYNYFIAIFKTQAGYGYVLWAFLQTILLSIINTGMWLEILSMIMPILVANIYRYGEIDHENTLDS